MEDLTNKILGLAKKYLKYPKAAVNAAISNAARIEYTSSGTGYLEGYYSPSHIEVFCSGCKRGRKIKKLKPKKRYYVRIRTYKIVDGKQYNSKWSKTYKK